MGMNYTQSIKDGLKVQNINLKPYDVPLNIYLKHNNTVLRLCFLEKESLDYLVVSETTEYGAEEIRIIPKDSIEYIGIFYDFASIEPRNKPVDKMII